MSDDIIDDLLNLHGPGHTNYTCLKAADEIKRLRADLAAARELLQSLRSLVPEAYRHHITTALAGEKK